MVRFSLALLVLPACTLLIEPAMARHGGGLLRGKRTLQTPTTPAVAVPEVEAMSKTTGKSENAAEMPTEVKGEMPAVVAVPETEQVMPETEKGMPATEEEMTKGASGEKTKVDDKDDPAEAVEEIPVVEEIPEDTTTETGEVEEEPLYAQLPVVPPATEPEPEPELPIVIEEAPVTEEKEEKGKAETKDAEKGKAETKDAEKGKAETKDAVESNESNEEPAVVEEVTQLEVQPAVITVADEVTANAADAKGATKGMEQGATKEAAGTKDMESEEEEYTDADDEEEMEEEITDTVVATVPGVPVAVETGTTVVVVMAPPQPEPTEPVEDPNAWYDSEAAPERPPPSDEDLTEESDGPEEASGGDTKAAKEGETKDKDEADEEKEKEDKEDEKEDEDEDEDEEDEEEEDEEDEDGDVDEESDGGGLGLGLRPGVRTLFDHKFHLAQEAVDMVQE